MEEKSLQMGREKSSSDIFLKKKTVGIAARQVSDDDSRRSLLPPLCKQITTHFNYLIPLKRRFGFCWDRGKVIPFLLICS
jgi:hypothetical protein